VLWAFVFSWHLKYTRQPVFRVKIEPELVAKITLTGLGIATLLAFLLDPRLRVLSPADYPMNLKEWAAMTLFSRRLPSYSWYSLLSHGSCGCSATERRPLLNSSFRFICNGSEETALRPAPPLGLFSGLLALRVATGIFSIYCYLRGGAFLVWWWTLLLECRHLAAWKLGTDACCLIYRRKFGRLIF